MKPDGGPAFPTSATEVLGALNAKGMTLRDYFAAKAMHAELNTSGWHAASAAALIAAAEEAGRSIEQQIAFNAYELADAMLAERAKP